MATRGNIAIVNEDGSITSIYCHYDSYPEYVGKILLNHYNDVGIINKLMELGDLSSLGEHLYAAGHTWSVPIEGVCVAYGRDRGEKGVESRVFKSIEQYNRNADNSGVNYQYLFEDGMWMYRKTHKGDWERLTPEVCK